MKPIIDWNELWKAIYASSPERTEKDRDPARIWDRRAPAYPRSTGEDHASTERDLSFLDLRPDDTVLDMGAGTGRLAVPVAAKVAHVTALDASGGMLSILRKRMEEEDYTNYSCIRRRWEDVEIGRDIDVHDVVIAAFSLGFYDLKAALDRLDRASRRSVYLFWHAGEWRGSDEMSLYRAVFGEQGVRQKGYPDYIFPVNILHDSGIYVNVRIYPAIWKTSYGSVDEAVNNWVTMHSPGLADRTPVRDFFSRSLTPTASGRLVYSAVRQTAVICWMKNAGRE